MNLLGIGASCEESAAAVVTAEGVLMAAGAGNLKRPIEHLARMGAPPAVVTA